MKMKSLVFSFFLVGLAHFVSAQDASLTVGTHHGLSEQSYPA